MLNRQNFAILFSTLIVSAFFLLDYSKLVFAQDQNVPVSYTLNNTVNDYALEFETPLSKFYLTFESGVNWDTTSLEITFEDNTSLNLTHIHPDESVFGETELTELLTSQLFSFDKNISNLTLYSNVSAKVHSIDNQISFSNSVSATDFQPQSIRQRLFTNLGLDIVTREEWGAPTQSLWYPQIAPSISQIVVHHSATNPNTADPAQAVRDIYEFHKNRCSDNSGSYDPNKPNCDEPEELWQDIGYNFLIDQNGSIYEGRAGGFGVTAAHAPPNYGTIGISLIGNFESSNPTGAQKESLKLLVARIADLYQLNLNWGTNLVGHRDKNVTLCPGTNFYNQLPSLANEIKALQKSNTNLNTVNDYVDQLNLSLTTELQMVGDLAQVSIKTNSISSQDLDYIKSNLDYVDASQSTSFGGSSFVLVDPDYLKVLIRETKLLDANIKIQPIFKYKTTSWDNTDLNRSVPSDYDANTHWNLEMINATEAWKSLGGCTSDSLCGGDPNVVVAVIDTGVAHENYDYDAGGSYSLINFQGFNIEVPLSATPNGTFNEGYDRRYSLSPELNNVNFVDAYDTYQDYICSVRSVTANPCNAAEIEKINHANDDNGHGTFVTTIIAGDTSDASSNKLVGIAHNVSIMPIKPFFPNDSSFCFFSNGTNDPNCTDPYYDYRSVTNSTLITQAVLYAVDNGADVINMSLSGSGFDPDLQDAINYAVQNNVVVVAASGNNGSDVANYFPGGMDNVISVGAVNPDNSRSYYSNYGSKLDLVAPVGESGTEMIASRTFDCYVTDSCSDESSGNLFYGDSNFTSESTPLVGAGTSFAAPQVSAVVALMKSKDANLFPNKIEQILIYNTKQSYFTSELGWGISDANETVNSLWSEWMMTDGTANSEVTTLEFGGSIFQTMHDENRYIYMRSSLDGVNWSPWELSGGQTPGNITMVEFNGKLYQAIRNVERYIFMRSSDDGVNWTEWEKTEGQTPGDVEMIEFNGRIYQAIRNVERYIFMRSSDDGVNWTEWEKTGGQTPGNIEMISFDGKIFQAIRNVERYIFMRSSDDGINWTSWEKNGGQTPGDIPSIEYNGVIYQMINNVERYIFMRYSNDGLSWSPWRKTGGQTPHDVSPFVFSGYFYQALTNTTNNIYQRNKLN